MKMRIGEFAAFCDISVRALHLYDRMGLLKPAQVDDATGYRYYLPEQMQTLNTIISFKKVGFSLIEIKEILATGLYRDVVIRKLREKKEENERIEAVSRYNIENIQSMLIALDGAPEERNPQAEAVRISRIACLDNAKLERDFSQILWL
jgi:DNA-binding transcriptional MerR regulator